MYLLTVIILFLSLMPTPPSESLGWDKLHHAVGIGAVAFTACMAFRRCQQAIWIGGGLAMLLGAMIEILQYLIPTSRTAEWGDLIADVVGASIVMLGVSLWKAGRAAIS